MKKFRSLPFLCQGILNIEKAFEMALVTPGKKKTTSKRSVSIKDLPAKKVVVP